MDAELAAFLKPYGDFVGANCFMTAPIKDMTRDELLCLIGYVLKEGYTPRDQLLGRSVVWRKS